MPVTPLAARAEVEAILSEHGLALLLDDNRDGATTESWLASALEEATVEAHFHLLSRYALATLATSPWLKWCVATLAAAIVCRRRGNPIPESLAAAAMEYRDRLRQIAQGDAPLIVESGLAAPKFDDSPSVSNLTIDTRFNRRKVRVTESNSPGPNPAPGVDRARTFYDPFER